MPARTLAAALAGLPFTVREEAIARNRGTTTADLRNVVLSKAHDLQTSINELIAVTEDGDTRSQLIDLRESLF